MYLDHIRCQFYFLMLYSAFVTMPLSPSWPLLFLFKITQNPINVVCMNVCNVPTATLPEKYDSTQVARVEPHKPLPSMLGLSAPFIWLRLCAGN